MGYKPIRAYFVAQGLDRDQSMLLPPSVEEYVDQDNPVRVKEQLQ